MTRIIIALLVVALGASIGYGVHAQGQRTANVEVRVWEDVNDASANYISARPEGGSWRTLGTIPLPLTDGVSSTGRFRYGDITVEVLLPNAPSSIANPEYEDDVNDAKRHAAEIARLKQKIRELEDITTCDAAEFAERVMDHWGLDDSTLYDAIERRCYPERTSATLTPLTRA